MAPRSCDQPDPAAAHELSQLSTCPDGKTITESNRARAYLCKISAVLAQVPAALLGALRRADLVVLQRRVWRGVHHKPKPARRQPPELSAPRPNLIMKPGTTPADLHWTGRHAPQDNR